jgi:MFS family permease
VTGPLLSRFGLHRVIWFDLSLQLVGSFLVLFSGYSRSFTCLVIGQFLIGIGDVYLLVAIAIIKHFPDQLAFAFSMASSVYGLATASSSLLFPFMVTASFLSVLWLFVGVMLLALLCQLAFAWMDTCVLPAYGYLSPPAAAHPRASDPTSVSSKHSEDVAHTWKHYAEVARAAWPSLQPTSATGRRTAKEMWLLLTSQSSIFWVFVVAGFFAYGGVYGPVWFFPAWIVQVHGYSSLESASISFGLINLISIFVTPVMGWVFDRHGSRLPVFLANFALQILALVLLAWVPSVPPAVVSVLFAGGFSVIRAVGISSLPLIVDAAFVDLASNIYMLVFALGVIFSENLSSVMVAHFGLIGIFPFSIALDVVCFVLILWLCYHANPVFQAIPQPFVLQLPEIRWSSSRLQLQAEGP